MKKIFAKIIILSLVLIFVDQLTKYLAANNWGNSMFINYSENTGAAFSMQIPAMLLIIITIFLLFFVAYITKKELEIKNIKTQIAVSLIFSGGLSNFIDRVINGYVTDFISIWKYPTFNLADVYITFGVLLIIIFYSKIKKS